MGGNWIPISDDQAQATKAIVEAGKDTFGYLTGILGDLPHDLVGLLVGDRVKVARAERLAERWAGAKKRLADRGILDPQPPSLKLALPILAAAADENRKELQDLWERLLAAAMDPNRQGAFRQSFITIVKEMDPFDALVFKAIIDNGGVTWRQSGRDAISASLRANQVEVLVSFDNLKRLGCLAFSGAGPDIDPRLSYIGTLLANAIA